MSELNTVADPDLQIGGGWGEGLSHPDPPIIVGGVVLKFFFRPSGPQFGPKITRWGGGGENAGPPGPLPWIRQWNRMP